MSLESDISALLSPLVNKRIYPDMAPQNVALPYITYQAVGGTAGWYVEGAMPSHKNVRVQFNVWAANRFEANRIGGEIEKAICESTFIAQPLGAAAWLHEDMTNFYGTRQDFSINYVP